MLTLGNDRSVLAVCINTGCSFLSYESI